MEVLDSFWSSMELAFPPRVTVHDHAVQWSDLDISVDVYLPIAVTDFRLGVAVDGEAFSSIVAHAAARGRSTLELEPAGDHMRVTDPGYAQWHLPRLDAGEGSNWQADKSPLLRLDDPHTIRQLLAVAAIAQGDYYETLPVLNNVRWHTIDGLLVADAARRDRAARSVTSLATPNPVDVLIPLDVVDTLAAVHDRHTIGRLSVAAARIERPRGVAPALQLIAVTSGIQIVISREVPAGQYPDLTGLLTGHGDRDTWAMLLSRGALEPAIDAIRAAQPQLSRHYAAFGARAGSPALLDDGVVAYLATGTRFEDASVEGRWSPSLPLDALEAAAQLLPGDITVTGGSTSRRVLLTDEHTTVGIAPFIPHPPVRR
ncbi:MAG: hypothetical protein GC157_18485 [Frankiales bacterium]|nr:hypothetical protein [Frankiales bacterium]